MYWVRRYAAYQLPTSNLNENARDCWQLLSQQHLWAGTYREIEQPGLCQWLALKPPIAQLHLGDGWDGDTSLDHLRKCLLQTFLGILLFTDLDCVTAIAHLQMLVYYTLYRCTISDGVIITSKSLHANPGTQLGCQKFMQLENTWARIMCLGSQLVG